MKTEEKEAPITSIPKDWRKIARAARKAGWAILVTGRGKLEWRGPNGQRVVVPSTGHRYGHTASTYLQSLKKAGVPGIA